MRKSLSLASLLLGTAVVAGCSMTSDSSNRRPADANNGRQQDVADTVEATVYAVGEDAAAGEIVHNVTSVEQMDVIPASATLEEWDLIAEDSPASEGFTWLHIVGSVTNNSKESQTVSSSGIYVMDSEGNQFDVSTDTTIYVDSDKSPVYISMQPTQTIEWEGYFEVPQDATGLVLVGNDLSFLPEDEVQIDLGL